MYFVTIVTHRRECLFGDVVDGAMRLNDAGRIARSCWLETPSHFPRVELDEFAVMPNHIHGVIFIVGATHASPLLPEHRLPPSPRGPLCGSVGAVVGSVKSAVTKRINVLRGTPGDRVWQRNYYERIIRDEHELNRARGYIQVNVADWAQDAENPLNHPS